MKLVVDGNILFSFFKKDSITRKLITAFEIFELYTPPASNIPGIFILNVKSSGLPLMAVAERA
ncbi:hypothetical protein CW713_02340 [Methanophagales archaeon]|nr:MAG: hypothetical protein CW714_01990 [Methanophagales archaeon]RJS84596.1 MAG: hypothetical protein CW713_02340 [Methanophagales archaeon]